MEQSGEPDGGAGELGRPVGDGCELPGAGVQSRLDPVLELEQHLPGVGGQLELVRGVVVGQEQDEGPQGVGVGGFDVFGYGFGLVVASADGVDGQAVQDAREDAPVAEAGLCREAGQGAGLRGDAEGQRWPLDRLGRTALAVDLELVAGVALEEHTEVGRGGVAGAGEGGEHVALGGQDGHPAAVGGEQGDARLRCHVVGHQPGQLGDDDAGGFLRGGGRVGQRLVRVGLCASRPSWRGCSAVRPRDPRRQLGLHSPLGRGLRSASSAADSGEVIARNTGDLRDPGGSAVTV